MRLFISVCLVALLIGCAARLDTEAVPDHESIPDDRIGLSKVDVREIPDPDPVLDVNPDPGEGSPLPRAYQGAPPLVSHNASDYLPITADENLCLDCHMVEGEAEEGLPTPIPESHYTDLRNAPSVVGESVAGARYNCSACHVAPTGATPLVTSRFGE
ncbi:MAG: hypothetical protein GTN89_06315 [Acidobacteria bacterium]|nr:hypothetical protein [Acidobacteriota bacterium]NIM61744.1 hypothetical protein [Acidobacteriota bacterium]NIO58924.1 hypothetical protein [Acidobacteriota bacterium]NIQ29978.1 hypothetical protein [Acidobacteriota bacterium]NIQ84711.1 hypothetical protein [Acidobacteriota bacterium]